MKEIEARNESIRGEECVRAQAEVEESRRRDLRNVAKNSILLALLSMASQFTGIVREGTISYFLGTTTVADSYVAAFQPIDVLTSTLLLSLPFGMVPFLLSYRSRYGWEAARWAATRVQIFTVLAVACGCACLYPASHWLIHLSDPVLLGSQLEMSVELWHWMMPAVVLAAITAFFLSELISEQRFLCQGLNSVLLNISIVGAGFLCWRWLGVFSLATGVLVGFSAQFLLQTWSVLRKRRPASGIPIEHPPLLYDAVSMIGPVVLLYFLGSLNAPIPRRFAAQFGDGALASFTYAMRAWSPILLLGALSISYPYFSSFAIALKEDTEHAKRLLLSMLRACFLFALPAMIAVTLLRFEIVRVLFFRGAFNAQAAMRVSSTIEFLSPFLLGSLLADLLARCLIALRRPLLACGIYGAMLALIWTVGELSQKFGFHAIALGWSLCFYAGAIGFALAVNRFLPNTISKVIPHLLRVIAAVSISGLCMAFVLHCIGSGLQESLMAALLRIAATLLTGGVVLVAAAWYLHVAEVQVLVQYGLAWSRKRLPS